MSGRTYDPVLLEAFPAAVIVFGDAAAGSGGASQCDPTPTGCTTSASGGAQVSLWASNRQADHVQDIDADMKGYVFSGWTGCESDGRASLDLVGPAAGYSPDTCNLAVDGTPKSITATYKWVGVETPHIGTTPSAILANTSLWYDDTSLPLGPNTSFGPSGPLTAPASTDTVGYPITMKAQVDLLPLGVAFDHWTGCTPAPGRSDWCLWRNPGFAPHVYFKSVPTGRVSYVTTGVGSALFYTPRGKSRCGTGGSAPKCTGQTIRTAVLNPVDYARLFVQVRSGHVISAVKGCRVHSTYAGLWDHANLQCDRTVGATTLTLTTAAVTASKLLTIKRGLGADITTVSAKKSGCSECGFAYSVPGSGKTLAQKIDTGRLVFIHGDHVSFKGCSAILNGDCLVLMTADHSVTVTHKP